jgi:molybdopterin converting factor small subunit
MPKVTCKYFVNVLSATKKDAETVDAPEGMTVQQFLDFMSEKYGDVFAKNIYAQGTLDGVPFKTPNIYLNKRRIQWVQDFPKGLETIVKDGDEFWFGLIVGGGSGRGGP